MKNFSKIVITLFLLLFTVVQIHCGASSGDTTTPQIDIPAPVSHLSISSPDENGMVRITAEAGFADPGSTVTITNQGSSSSLIIPLAVTENDFQQNAAESSITVTADANGAFQTQMAASAGDSIVISYVKNSTDTSASTSVPNTQHNVDANTNILDIAVDASSQNALIVSNDGTHGYVHVMSLSSGSVSKTITLENASGASQIAHDGVTGLTIVIDTTNSVAWVIDVDSGTTNSEFITSSTDVATVSGEGDALIAHNTTVTVSYFGLQDLSVLDFIEGQVDDETLFHQQALFVAADQNDSLDVFATVSEMTDESLYVLAFQISSEGDLSQTSNTQLANLTNPGGMALFNSGGEVLVTDRNNDQVLRVSLTSDTITSITVGDDPRGVVVDQSQNKAYVVNSGGRTLSVIDLSDNTVTTSSHPLGLSPTELAHDSAGSLSEIGIVNTGDETIHILDKASL